MGKSTARLRTALLKKNPAGLGAWLSSDLVEQPKEAEYYRGGQSAYCQLLCQPDPCAVVHTSNTSNPSGDR
jgi:hypothetical protein